MAKQKDSYASYLFHEGTNYQAHKMFSPAPSFEDGVGGWDFAVWAPNASSVSVVGDFNGWNACSNVMARISEGGVYETFVENLSEFDLYKFAVKSDGRTVLKADP